MLELHYKKEPDSSGKGSFILYYCTEPPKKATSYLDMLLEGWKGSDAIENKFVMLTETPLKRFIELNTVGDVKGQSNNQQQLYYIRTRNGIRVPFYQLKSNVVVILFSFWKKSAKEKSKFFNKAQNLQIQINTWLEQNDYPIQE